MEEDKHSASASDMAVRALKAGKALAGAAKGAAAGPYGILAAGLWENRRLAGVIAASLLLLLLLPVLFILMLPPLIFGNNGLDEVPKGVLNDSAVVVSNIKEAETAIEEILRKKHNAVIKQIEIETQQLGKQDKFSITDEFADTIIFESTLIISQFCASLKNYQEIKLDKLKQLLTEYGDNIFSYHVETSVVEETNAKTGETKTITHYEYIIDYAGDQYYAEHVFQLDEKQLALSVDYADNLHLLLYDTLYNVEINPGLLPGETGNKAVDLAMTKLGTPYSQALRNQEGYFDCSSFTYWVYSHTGIRLAYDASNTAAAQGRYIVENRLAVSKDSLAPGDLVFYSFQINNRYLNIDHVAIYCGNGYVVDASSSKGKVVCRPIYNTNKIVLCGRPYA